MARLLRRPDRQPTAATAPATSCCGCSSAPARSRSACPALRSTDFINTIPPEREPWFPGDEEMERQIRAADPLERRGDGVVGQPQGPRGRRPHRDVRLGRQPLRGRLQPLLPRQGPPGRRRPAVHPGPRLPRHLRPGVPDEAAQLRPAPPLPPGGAARPRAGPVVVPPPAADAGVLGVPDGLDGPRRAELDLPGALQPLPAQPRDQGHQRSSTSGRSSATARWASRSRSARSASPHARSSTTSRSSSTATSSSSTARSAATARSSRSWSRTSAAPAGTSIKVVWGREWDALLAQDVDGALVNQMNKTPDGQFQTYSVETGAYIREHFFGGDARLRKMVEGHDRPRHRAAAARWPRLPQGVRRVRRGRQARRPADGDPGPHHQGLDDRRPRGQERHPPDEEAERPDAQGVPRPARAADHRPGHRRALRVRRLGAVLPPGRGLGGARVPPRPAPRARRRRARCAGSNPRADHAARRRDVRRAQAGLGQAEDRHHDGARPAAQGPDEGPRDRSADRADRPRRVPHVRHGLDVQLGQDLQPGRPALRVGRPQAAAGVEGVAAGPDAPRGHLRGRLRRVRHGRRDRRTPRTASR